MNTAISSSAVSNAYGREAELEFSRLLTERKNQRSGELAYEQAFSPSWQGEKDEVNISAAARNLFDAYQSATTPLGNEALQATMSAVTRHGSRLTLEAREVSPQQFSLAQFGERSGTTQPLFNLSGAQSKTPELAYTLTVEGADGTLTRHELTGNTRLTEDAAGNISLVESGARALHGGEGQDILINLDGSEVSGGGGDDIIFDLSENARISGDDGNDVITSMGNGTTLNGGAGDDAIAALHDTIRRYTEDRRINEKGETYVVGRPRNHQQVTMEGGDGNDGLLAQTGLYQGSVSGGLGMDTIELGNVLESSVDGGDGSDTITARSLRNSSLFGGAGNDTITLLEGLKNSRLQGGDGDDDITIHGNVTNSKIDGGSGSDVIELLGEEVTGSEIKGGTGDDLIHTTGKVASSHIEGGAGDDFMWSERGAMGDGQGNMVIDGGTGDDTMYLGPLSGAWVDGGDGKNTVVVEQATRSRIERASS